MTTAQNLTPTGVTTDGTEKELPPIRVTTDGIFLFIVTDTSYLAAVEAIAQESPEKASMIPFEEGKTLGNVVLDASAVGFSPEAIELIQLSLLIEGEAAIVNAWQSVRGATFSWVGTPTMMLPASLLTITSETAAFDFSKFQQIPNDVPSYSQWLQILGLEPHAG